MVDDLRIEDTDSPRPESDPCLVCPRGVEVEGPAARSPAVAAGRAVAAAAGSPASWRRHRGRPGRRRGHERRAPARCLQLSHQDLVSLQGHRISDIFNQICYNKKFIVVTNSG